MLRKSDYDTKVHNLELKIPDVSGKLNTSDFNSKVSELEIIIEQNKKLVLSLHYNGDSFYLFVNGSQELKFK